MDPESTLDDVREASEPTFEVSPIEGDCIAILGHHVDQNFAITTALGACCYGDAENKVRNNEEFHG
jgi:hypothetical protein